MSQQPKSHKRVPLPGGFKPPARARSLKTDMEKKRPLLRNKTAAPIEESMKENMAIHGVETPTNKHDLGLLGSQDKDHRETFHDKFKELKKSYRQNSSQSKQQTAQNLVRRTSLPKQRTGRKEVYWGNRHFANRNLQHGQSPPAEQSQEKPRQQDTVHSENEHYGAKTYEQWMALKGEAEKAKADAVSLEVQQYNEAAFLGEDLLLHDSMSPSGQDISQDTSPYADGSRFNSTDAGQASPEAKCQALSNGLASNEVPWSSSLAGISAVNAVITSQVSTIPAKASQLLHEDPSALDPGSSSKDNSSLKGISSVTEASMTRDCEALRRQQFLSLQQSKQLEAFRGKLAGRLE